jgi:hypothetical protein
MNGAELPSGHALRVEPAYESKALADAPVHSTTTRACEEIDAPISSKATIEIGNSESNGDGDDDLDDFFDSL